MGSFSEALKAKQQNIYSLTYCQNVKFENLPKRGSRKMRHVTGKKQLLTII